MNKICFFITLVFTVLSQLISLTFAEEYRFRLVEPSEVRAIGFNRELPPEYDPTGRIDPFQPPIDSNRTAPAPKPLRTDCIPNPTLEKIDLSQLKLTGAIVAENDDLALMEEASGRGHIVQEGICIGIHGGKVAAIMHDRIIIHEAIQNGAEEIKVKKTEIKLRRDLD